MTLKQVARGEPAIPDPHPEDLPDNKNIPYMVQVVARLQSTSFMAGLKGTGVHPAEAYVIHELWKNAPLSQTQLSSRLDIGHATVGKTLQRLERKGFVERLRLGEDRRTIVVSLTAKGLDAHEHFQQATRILVDEIGTLLGEDDAARFLAALHKLSKHFRDRAPQPATPRATTVSNG